MSRRINLPQEATIAREAALTENLRLEIEADAEAAMKPVEVICGVPMPVQFGKKQDDTMWLGCGIERREYVHIDFSGTPRAASSFASLLNSLPLIRDTLRSLRANARDPDTDAAMSVEDGANVEACLRAMGERL